MSDTISRKGVFIPDITVEMFRNASLESIEDLMASGEMEDILLPSAQPEQLTDAEQRIFLKAIEREEKVCKKVDEEWGSGDEECEINLVHACHEIIRKVKGELWT